MSITRHWPWKAIGGLVAAAILWLLLDFLWFSTMATLKVGDQVPEFTAETHSGQKVSLADFRGKQIVVLYFYPRDNTPVCTAQACAFRDSYEDFAQDGAVVIGVSSDSLERHRAFAEKKQLPFQLVSDGDGSIRKAFGVSDRLGLIPRRVTFVIDREGTIRHVFEATFSSTPHIESARKVVRELAAASGK
jgi:thioredoxin-dependent peroxiredoxin